MHDVHDVHDVHGMACALLQALAPAAQGLYLRLVLRRGPWFPLQALHYPELPDPLPAAQELVAAGRCTKVLRESMVLLHICNTM
jgi:Fanconi-associated nuclease 1